MQYWIKLEKVQTFKIPASPFISGNPISFLQNMDDKSEECLSRKTVYDFSNALSLKDGFIDQNYLDLKWHDRTRWRRGGIHQRWVHAGLDWKDIMWKDIIIISDAYCFS